MEVYLFPEHVWDDLNGMHTPLLLALCTGDVENQLVHSAHIQGPQHLVVNTGIVISSLLKSKYEES